MATIAEMERLAEQGNIRAQIDLGNALESQGDIKGSERWFKLAADQVGRQTDPDSLNLCLLAKRNLAILLSRFDAVNNKLCYEYHDPKRAFDLFQEIISKYPNERQAMFAKFYLGGLYFREHYEQFGICHDPDKGISLLKEFEDEYSRRHPEKGIKNIPDHCFQAGHMLFNGRYITPRDGQDGSQTIGDLEYALKLLKLIERDDDPHYDQFYGAAQELIPIVEEFLHTKRGYERVVGIWEHEDGIGGYIRFEITEKSCHHTSSAGADYNAGFKVSGDKLLLNTGGELIINDDNTLTLSTGAVFKRLEEELCEEEQIDKLPALLKALEKVDAMNDLVQNGFLNKAMENHHKSPDAEKEQRRIEQSRRWEQEGLCKYCGGQLAGLFTKKCKSCGKPK